MAGPTKILTVFDIHLSDQTPGYRAEGYADQIFEKLWETVKIAEEKGVDHVLWCGDVFDQKAPSKVSHRLVSRVSDVLEAYGRPVSIVIGNHDLSSGTLETLPKQPINHLSRLSNVSLLAWDPVQLDEDVILYPIPGVPLDDDWLKHYVTGSSAKRPIIVSHQLVAKDISVYPAAAQASFQSSSEIAKVTDASLVISGDLHSRQGVYVQPNGKGGNVGFANLGATCRLSTRDVDHVPHVLVLTVEGDERRSLKFEEIPLKSARPASEVYRLEDHYEAKEHQADIDEAIRRINSTTKILVNSVDAVMEDLKQNDTVTLPIRDKAIELIEAVR